MTATDTRVPNLKHKDSDYAADCVAGTCSCAPGCPVCGKAKCWDARQWPGYHDWRCAECCQAHVTTLWLPADEVKPAKVFAPEDPKAYGRNQLEGQ
jgi:hypothetical protein